MNDCAVTGNVSKEVRYSLTNSLSPSPHPPCLFVCHLLSSHTPPPFLHSLLLTRVFVRCPEGSRGAPGIADTRPLKVEVLLVISTSEHVNTAIGSRGRRHSKTKDVNRWSCKRIYRLSYSWHNKLEESCLYTQDIGTGVRELTGGGYTASGYTKVVEG